MRTLTAKNLVIWLPSSLIICGILFWLFIPSLYIFHGIQEGHQQIAEKAYTHQAQWETQQIRHYRYTLHQMAMNVGLDDKGPQSSVDIEVNDGAITTTGKVLVPEGTSIVGLFRFIQLIVEKNADIVQVTYNAELGYPEEIYVKYHRNYTDDLISFSVENFEILP